jgi:hypothetical protein
MCLVHPCVTSMSVQDMDPYSKRGTVAAVAQFRPLRPANTPPLHHTHPPPPSALCTRISPQGRAMSHLPPSDPLIWLLGRSECRKSSKYSEFLFRDRIPVGGGRFSAPAQTGRGAYPQWVPGHSRGWSAEGVVLTTHPHLAPRLKE